MDKNNCCWTPTSLWNELQKQNQENKMNETFNLYKKLISKRYDYSITKRTVVKYLKTSLDEIHLLKQKLSDLEKEQNSYNLLQKKILEEKDLEIEQLNKLCSKLAFYYVKKEMK